MGYGYAEYSIGHECHLIEAYGNGVVMSIDLMCETRPGKGQPDALMNDVASQAKLWIMEGIAFTHAYEQEMTSFQKKAYDVLKLVPKGKVTTYRAIAEAIGCASPRPVGRAMGMNKIPLLVPCHRVVCSDGDLGGYAYGRDLKGWILEKEGINGAKTGKVNARYIIKDLLDFNIL